MLGRGYTNASPSGPHGPQLAGQRGELRGDLRDDVAEAGERAKRAKRRAEHLRCHRLELARRARPGGRHRLRRRPVVTAPTASDVRYTTAHLAGEVNPEDHETYYHLEYVSDTQFQASEWAEAQANGFGSLPEGIGPTPVEVELGGLQPGTVYHFRLVAENTANERTEAVAASTFETEPVAKPAVTIEAAGPATGSNARLSATVEVPAPAGPAYRTGWRFECEPGCGGNLSGAIEADPTSHEFPSGPVTVEGEASGLEPNTTYTVKLVATDAGGSAEAGSQPVQFTTAEVAPEVSYILSVPVREVTDSIATVQAIVDPRNATLTECRFEWGTDEGYGHSATCSTESTSRGLLASAHITGLKPSTAYHFRVDAADAAGSTQGEDRSFETYPAPAPQPTCANEAIRTEQHATNLPDCRAWEQASPHDKNGGDVTGDGENAFAAAAGNGTTFEVVPDAPVTKFVLSLKGGRKGLIQNSEDVCAGPQRASARFVAHDGAVHDTTPAVADSCGSKKPEAHKRRRSARR